MTGHEGVRSGRAPVAPYDEFDILIRELDVLRRRQVTPRMMRVTLGGPNLTGFESHQCDEHVKLVFPDPDTGVTRAPRQDGDHLDWPTPFPPTREYTVRRYDAEAEEIDIDFVLHEGGLASTWALEAPIGSSLWVAGPRPSRVVPADFGFHVLAADETGLPAVARWLEELPADARGAAVVEVADADEEQELRVPAGLTLTWVHRGDVPPGNSSRLGEHVRGIELPEDTWTYVWTGAEAGSVKPVRTWARKHGIGQPQSDISGYWKAGRTNAVPTGRLERLKREIEHLAGHFTDR